ncbi:MAG: hypothetical protein CMF39_05635 [Legionellaceae bacterium]|nr:hypothetical protein [Legionellaceae bacterium]|tara:strand:+ start:573 stop:1067 length:495 start_codon:yes stop_codon:yes gene_type:complete
MANELITLPGVAIKIENVGVFIQGESNVGKSELALALIQQGHALIADDAVNLRCHDQTTIELSCPTELQNLLELRNFGILNIQQLYGDNAVCDKASCNLIIQLEKNASTPLDRVLGSYDKQLILGAEIPRITIGNASERSLVACVKLAVRCLSSPPKSWKISSL